LKDAFAGSRTALPLFNSLQMSLFDKLVNDYTVEHLGVNMSLWTSENQSLLREGMILAMKENPDWTEDEVLEEIRRQVSRIVPSICEACHADYATMPNEYGPDDLGDRVCADCFWDFRKEYRYLVHQSHQKSSPSTYLYAFCQGCGDHVSACVACEKRTEYHVGHCKDCYMEFHQRGDILQKTNANSAPLFICKACETKDTQN
jgi:hypothetical protein